MFTNLELSELCLQISMYVESGIPIDEAFRSMQEVGGVYSGSYSFIADKMEEGSSLYEALEDSKLFPVYMVNMCRLGQETGNLGIIMRDLSEYYDSQHRISVNLKNALHYPFIMMSMLLVIMAFLFKKVLPTFNSIYTSFGMSISDVMNYKIEFAGNLCCGLLVVILICMVCYIIFSMKNRDSVELLLKKFSKNNKMLEALNTQRLAMALGMCIRGGFDFDRSLELASLIIDNTSIIEKIYKCKHYLENGASIYESILFSKLFAGHSAQLIKAGVQSGHLDEVMTNLAKSYSQEVTNRLDRFMETLEPSVVIVLALSVGIILVSVMLPLASLLGNLGV